MRPSMPVRSAFTSQGSVFPAGSSTDSRVPVAPSLDPWARAPEFRRLDGWGMNRVRRSPLLIALGLLSIAPAGTLRAQVDGPHVSIFPWAGYANYAKNVNFKDKPIYGGS